MFTDCPQIDDISNGYITCTNGYKVGSECTFYCETGMNCLI